MKNQNNIANYNKIKKKTVNISRRYKEERRLRKLKTHGTKIEE